MASYFVKTDNQSLQELMTALHAIKYYEAGDYIEELMEANSKSDNERIIQTSKLLKDEGKSALVSPEALMNALAKLVINKG